MENWLLFGIKYPEILGDYDFAYTAEFKDTVLGLNGVYKETCTATEKKYKPYTVSFSGTVLIKVTADSYDISVFDFVLNGKKYADIFFGHDGVSDICTFKRGTVSLSEDRIRPFVELYPKTAIYRN